MEYVYKYVDEGVCKYIGITNDLQKRFYQHTKDKLKEMLNPDVFYFPVCHRGDADMLETYLINYYKTGDYYNVSKTKKGDFSFLDICDRLPWVLYDGSIDTSLEPFSVSGLIGKKNIEIIYKPVYRDRPIYVDKTNIDMQIANFLEIYYEEKRTIDIVIQLQDDYVNKVEQMIDTTNIDHDDDIYIFVSNGLILLKEKLSLLKQYQEEIKPLPVCLNTEKASDLRSKLIIIEQQIKDFENELYKKDKIKTN